MTGKASTVGLVAPYERAAARAASRTNPKTPPLQRNRSRHGALRCPVFARSTTSPSRDIYPADFNTALTVVPAAKERTAAALG